MNTQVPIVDEIKLVEVGSLTQGNRTEVKDYWLRADINEAKLRNGLFIRLVAKGRKITNVDFTYSIFDACYFRKCNICALHARIEGEVERLRFSEM